MCKKLKDPLQRYTYIRLIDLSHYSQIFVTEFDAEVFLCIIDTFNVQVLDNEKFKTVDELTFIANFLTIIMTKTPSFDFVLDFMGDEEKAKIKKVVSSLSQVED